MIHQTTQEERYGYDIGRVLREEASTDYTARLHRSFGLFFLTLLLYRCFFFSLLAMTAPSCLFAVFSILYLRYFIVFLVRGGSVVPSLFVGQWSWFVAGKMEKYWNHPPPKKPTVLLSAQSSKPARARRTAATLLLVSKFTCCRCRAPQYSTLHHTAQATARSV